MRPRRTVLDEPLDFDARQHVFETPEIAFNNEPEVFVTPAAVTSPEPVEEAPAEEPVAGDDNLIYAEMTAEEVLAQTSFSTQDEPAAFAEVPKPSHKKMSGFQRFILFLLVVLVLLVLATVYLYITGRITLPDMVIVVIEKGLKLIQ